MSRRVSAILLTLGVVCFYFWIHWRVSGVFQIHEISCYKSLPPWKRLAAVQPPTILVTCMATGTGNSPSCGTVLVAIPNTLFSDAKLSNLYLDLTASLADFENSVYSNSTAHNSCPLVGSSGNLRNHASGKLIDSNNIVIRINNPPVKGYETFVGYRPADLMLINNHLFGGRCLVPTNHSTLYVCASSSGLREDESSVRLCKAHKKAKIYGLSKYIEHISRDLLEVYAQWYNLSRKMHGKYNIRPASGLKDVLFSILVCRSVHMFGFGMQGTDIFHYFSTDRVYRPLQHLVDLEMKIFKDIERGTLDSDIINLKDKVFGKVTVHH